jgi:hypothetical protein
MILKPLKQGSNRQTNKQINKYISRIILSCKSEMEEKLLGRKVLW